MDAKRSMPVALLAAARANGKLRSKEVVRRWQEAKLEMEAEILEHGGIYPHNKGRLDVKEVCRRARISQQTLYAKDGPHIRTTLIEIKDWCEARLVRKAPQVKKAITAQITFWKSELEKVASQICKYELMLVEKDIALSELKDQNDKLRTQLKTVSKKSVHLLPVKSQKN